MSNILKVTTPAAGYDSSHVARQNEARQAEDTRVKNPVDTRRIVRADGREQTGAQEGVRREIDSESNFGNFVQSLRELPKLREIMSRMVFAGMADIVEAGAGKGTAEEISSLFGMLRMTPEELAAFLKSQMNGANRFHGTLFDMLRQVMDQSASAQTRASILEFLKRYNDLSSGAHLLENIKANLREIEARMFRSSRQELAELADRLLAHSLDSQAENIRILKEQIIPYLGKYVSDSREMGTVRDLISLLTLNISRYENGSLDQVMQAFRKLMDFPSFQKTFYGVTAENFREMLMNADFDRAAGKMAWIDTMLDIMRAGIRGEAGLENREAFLNVMNSILINESVYMPVTHVMLPLILNGVPMFSEIWVDPEEDSSEPGSSEKGIKLLIKLDLKDVGFFDMMLYYEKGKVDMLLHYPEELSAYESEIRSGIREIITKNKLEVEYLGVEPGKDSIPVSSAFPKIIERRNAVDVTA